MSAKPDEMRKSRRRDSNELLQLKRFYRREGAGGLADDGGVKKYVEGGRRDSSIFLQSVRTSANEVRTGAITQGKARRKKEIAKGGIIQGWLRGP